MANKVYRKPPWGQKSLKAFSSVVQLVLPLRKPVVQSMNPPRTRRVVRRVSVPQLYEIWCSLQQTYFPDREDLRDYTVVWANGRRKRTLASCNIRTHTINVAKEMNHPTSLHLLSPLIYHEMCHAVLGQTVGKNNRGMRWHGPEFRTLEARHPGISELNRWVKQGGWRYVIRSHRSKEAAQRRIHHTNP